LFELSTAISLTAAFILVVISDHAFLVKLVLNDTKDFDVAILYIFFIVIIEKQ